MVSRRRVRQRLHGAGRANKVNSDLARMNDLPDEILLEVTKEVDDESLFRLSMTSRRFNSFTLPILFQRHNFGPGLFGFCLTLNQLPKFILTALRTALFPHGCSWLVIGGLSSTAQHLKKEMLNILLLVKQWPGLSHLTLSFGTYCWAGIRTDISKWKQTFSALLDITSTQCMKLEVVGHGDYYDSSDSRKPQRLSIAKRSGIKAVTPAASRSSRLSSFSLHSPILLIPQFYPKTLSILSSATITCLSLNCIISAEIVNKLLQDLVIPSLTSLTFHPISFRVGLSLKDFAAFLCRHQSIQILEVHYEFTPDKNPIPTPPFPSLKRLRAHPKSIPWFLASVRELPVFTDIGILCEDMQFALFREVYAVISRIPRDIHITFDIYSPLPFQSWVRSCIGARTTRKHGIQSLFNVSNVTLNIVWSISEDFKITLVSWLALFPSLRLVNILGEIPGEDWKNPESDFIKLVASTCTKLQTMKRYGQSFQLHTLRH